MRKLIILVGTVIIALSLTIPVKAGITGTKCTLLGGSKVVQVLPGGNIRLGIHPQDILVELVEKAPIGNINQLNNITNMNWNNSYVVAFVIHPNPKNPGFAETIYLYVRAIDLKQCIR